MRCALVGLSVALLLSTPAAWGQRSGGNSDDNATGTSLAERQPAENVRGGAVRERAPGRIIDAARARHRELRDLRLAAQRTGETSTLAPEPAAAGLAGSLSDLLGGSLADLIGTFLNSGLAGTLGSQTGGSLQPAGTGGTDFSNLPPEVIQMLAGAGIDLKDLNQRPSEDPAAQPLAQPKSLSRAQTNGQEQPKFMVRWANAMLSTVFTALTVSFQTPDFIDVLKDLFRPFFIPEDADDDESAGDAAGDGANGSQGKPGQDGGDGEDTGGLI